MNFLGLNKEETAMEGMIKNANRVLDQASSRGVRGIPKSLFEKCHGMVLISSVSSSFFIKGSAGTGIIIAKNDDGTWGLPCACGMTGTGYGVGMGVTYDDVLIFIMDKSNIEGAGSRIGISLGAHVGATLGYGRSAGFSLAKKGGNVSIAFSTGASFGASIDGGVVGVRPGVNEAFYEQKGIKAADILLGRNGVKLPIHREHVLDSLYRKLEALGHTAMKEEGIFSDSVDHVDELIKEDTPAKAESSAIPEAATLPTSQ